MKKWMSFLLAGALLITLTACNDTSTISDAPSPSFVLEKGGYIYTITEETNSASEVKILTITDTDTATGKAIQTIRFAGNEWFTKSPLYRIDVNFDGYEDLILPFARPASGAYFQAYVWDVATGQYRLAPTFECLANVSLDAANGVLLSSRTADKSTTYGIYRYDADKKDYVPVRTLYWKPDEDLQTLLVTERDYTVAEEMQTRQFSAVAVYGIGADPTDTAMAPYFAVGSVWDLDGNKWDIPLLSRCEYLY